MSTATPSTVSVGSSSGRTATILNLKTLKSPEEGGTKRDYEEFLERVGNHASISWDFGDDIAYVLEHTSKPTIAEPVNLTTAEAKKQWQVRVWNQKVDRYAVRIETLEENMSAMYSLIKENVSKLMKAKLRAKEGVHGTHVLF